MHSSLSLTQLRNLPWPIMHTIMTILFQFHGSFENTDFNCIVYLDFRARRASSDGSMPASGSAGPGFDPRRDSKFSIENFKSWC